MHQRAATSNIQEQISSFKARHVKFGLIFDFYIGKKLNSLNTKYTVKVKHLKHMFFVVILIAFVVAAPIL